MLLNQPLGNGRQSLVGFHFKRLRDPAAPETARVLLGLVRVRVDPVRVVEDHVVVERLGTGSGYFEDFGRERGRDDRVGGGDGGDDVLDDALCQAERDAGYAELGSAFAGSLVDPRYVVGVVAVELHVVTERVLFRPQQDSGVLYAVLGQTGRVGDGAQREVDL